MDESSRSALVTGAASGIGAATARRLAGRGDRIALLDRSEAGLAETARAIETAGGKAITIAGDLLEAGTAERAVDAATHAFGGLDLLIAAAGIPGRHTALEASDAIWDEVIAINLTGVFRCSRAAIPVMQARGGGAIVIVASAWGLVAGPRAVAYCAAKGGVVNLTRALAIDHGPDIRVNCVCPGDIDTPLLRQEYRAVGLEPGTALREAAASRPAGRIGTAEDVAAAIEYLASAEAGYVTGAALVIDGGWLAGG